MIIRFIYVPAPHTSKVLADTLVQCLMDWNLDIKLFTLTVDNCSTNDVMIDRILKVHLGYLYWVVNCFTCAVRRIY